MTRFCLFSIVLLFIVVVTVNASTRRTTLSPYPLPPSGCSISEQALLGTGSSDDCVLGTPNENHYLHAPEPESNDDKEEKVKDKASPPKAGGFGNPLAFHP